MYLFSKRKKKSPKWVIKKRYPFEYLKKFLFGGAWGIQTPDLGNANAALYQLS